MMTVRLFDTREGVWNTYDKFIPEPVINSSRLIVPCHTHNQAGFGNPIIKERGFSYLAILKMGFTFWVFARVQGNA